MSGAVSSVRVPPVRPAVRFVRRRLPVHHAHSERRLGVSTRLYFATDVHGSEVCWRKFINSAQHYGADVLILGGDMTGKAVIPIIDEGSERYYFHMQDIRHDFQGADDLAAKTRFIRDHGYYPAVMTAAERDEYTADPDKLDELFHSLMRETVHDWVAVGRRQARGLRAPVHRLSRQRRPAGHRRDPRDLGAHPGGRGQRRRPAGGLSARLQRLHEPHAVGHRPRGGRRQAQGAHHGASSRRPRWRPSAS